MRHENLNKRSCQPRQTTRNGPHTKQTGIKLWKAVTGWTLHAGFKICNFNEKAVPMNSLLLFPRPTLFQCKFWNAKMDNDRRVKWRSRRVRNFSTYLNGSISRTAVHYGVLDCRFLKSLCVVRYSAEGDILKIAVEGTGVYEVKVAGSGAWLCEENRFSCQR